MTTPLQKYKLTCWLFQTEAMNYYSRGESNGAHSHHIKPRAKYPELAKDYKNLVNVPPILHAVLHHWLHQAYMDAGNEKDAKRFDLAEKIISQLNGRDKKRELPIGDLDTFAEIYWDRICQAAKAVKHLSTADESDTAKDTCETLWKTDAYIRKKFAKVKKDILQYDEKEIDEIINELSVKQILDKRTAA